MLLTASHIFNGSDFLPANTQIRVQGDRIEEIGNLSVNPNEPTLNLKDFVLLPGFVNAHCHLELTGIGPIQSKEGFADWIRAIIGTKEAFPAEQLPASFEEGIRRLLKSGVTAIGDHISWNSPVDALLNSKLKGRIFGEVLGVSPAFSQKTYAALRALKEKAAASKRFTFNHSPHSVHAVSIEALKELFQTEPAPLSCHLAESADEREFFESRSGALFDLISERYAAAGTDATSGIETLSRLGLPLEKLLVIHGNYLTESEIQTIVRHQISIVHCPGSHQYFGHQAFPLKALLDRGIPVALGTDSITSNTDLDFLMELRLVRQKHPEVGDLEILKMATIHGARALQMKSIGEIAPKKTADIIGFKVNPGQSPQDAVFAATQADFTMIDGQALSSASTLP